MQSQTGISILEDKYFIMDPMRPTIVYQLDLENEMMRILLRQGQHEVAHSFYISFEDFLDNMFNLAFEREFGRIKMQQLSTRNRIDSQGLIPELVFRLPPGAMPRTVRRIMGNEAGRLSISGSTRLTISAGRTHRQTLQAVEWGGNTDFDITMRQDFNLNLRGNIGEKISVSVRYNSGQDSNIFDPNNINIKYTGDEDEIVQSIEAGNISLSLTGSRLISHSASSQGLFGVRSQFKLGDLSITAVASREEAQKNTRTFRGTSQPDSSFVQSRNFARRRMFYVVHPLELFSTYTEEDDVPPSWRNNAIRTDSDGRWIYNNPSILPTRESLKVYIARDSGVTPESFKGILVNPDGSPFYDSEILLDFLELFEGATADYTYDFDKGVITLNNPVQHNHTIAISYTEVSGHVVGNTSIEIAELKPIRLKNQDLNQSTWINELRSVYDLGMRNVRADGFLLEVFTELSDKTRNYWVTETEGAVGWEIFNYLKLDTNQDGVLDSNDLTIDLSRGMIELPFINPFYGLGDTLMYETNNMVGDDDYSHEFFIRGRIGRDQISLGNMMILPGSVRVRLNGRDVRENIDYIVDYDFGNVTFLTAEGRDPDSDIQIDYENRPLFSIDTKTMMGFRADWSPSRIFKLGGTFVYQSETMTDKRPRVGNEGRTLILAGIDGEIAVDAPFITTAIDYIPLISTEESSRLTLSGEVAMNIPRFQGSKDFGDGNEAWIDDMESIQEIFPLGIMRPTWMPASEPFATNLVRGRVNWFNPDNVYYRDVYPPNTMSERDRTEKLMVMDVKVIPPAIYTPGVSTPIWGGLMKFVGNQLDFSEREYIEFLVKVDSVAVNFSQVKMYIDMGDVSEDFYVENGGRGVLNTEDGVVSGFKNTGVLHWMDDIGLSGIPAGHPGYDPYDMFSDVQINGEFPFINGTSGNGVLDTEDLNGNGSLDTLERFFRYQVTLGDTLTSFFQSEYNGWQLYRIPLKNNPLMETLSNVSGSEANLESISFVRMWFETETLAKMRFVYIDVVGNKWKELPIRTRELFQETEVTQTMISLNNTFTSIETIDNHRSLRYVPPPGTTTSGSDDEISLEQAMMVHYNNILPGQISLVRQRFRENYNLLSYNSLRYWVHLESHPNAITTPDSVYVIFRLGVDLNRIQMNNTNYYEILKPINVNRYTTRMDILNWHDIEVNFTDITRLKTLFAEGDSVATIIRDDLIYTVEGDNVTYKFIGDDTIYRIVGNPTLSNIRDIALGIQVPDGEMPFTGTVYFNDIRVANPNQNIGYAAIASFNAKLADFSTLSVSYEWRTADFFNSTSRNLNLNSLDESVRLNISNDYSLHKFFPVAWGLRFPLRFTYEHRVGIPKYKANSDILREILSPEEQERDRNINFSRSVNSDISMTRTPNSKILAYTLRNMTFGANITERITLNATRADTTLQYRGTGTYNLSIPQDRVRIRLFGNYHLGYVPRTFNNSLTYRGETPKRWDWRVGTSQEVDEGVFYWRLPHSVPKNTRFLDTRNEIRHDLLTDLSLGYDLTTRRDLMTESLLYGVNIGTEEDRTQRFEANYNPFYMTRLSPTQISSNITYREGRTLNRSKSHEAGEDIYDFQGNVSRGVRVNMTLRNSDWMSSVANKLGERTNRRYEANTRQSGQGFDDLNNNDLFDNRIDGLMNPNIRDDDFFNPDFDWERERERELGYMFDGDDLRRPGRELGMGREIDDEGNLRIPDNENEDNENERPSGRDTERESRGPSTLIPDIFGFLARIQNFSLSYENTFTSRFEQRENRPDFLYQLGIPNVIPDSELQSRGTVDRYSASTGFPIFRNLQTDWRYSYQIDKNYTSTGPGAMTETTTWPDVRVTLSGFERLIRAERFLNSSRLTSTYNYAERLAYQGSDWNTPLSGTYTHSFSPLIGWTGNWSNNLTTTFNCGMTLTEQNTYGTNPIIRETIRMTYAGTVGYSFSSEQGLKIPFTGRSIQIRNQLQCDLTVNYETNKANSISITQTTPETDTTRLLITPRASYNFHRNVRGGLSGTYDVSHNKIRDESLNIFRMDMWVEVTF